MGDDIKEDINDMKFFERNMSGFNKEYDLKLYNQKNKKKSIEDEEIIEEIRTK